MSDVVSTFDSLGLSAPVLKALNEVGYESPSPIQAACIPHLLEGRDLLGQAQTGTGKTAAFALPVLSQIDPKAGEPQVLVLAPTRELAIQVAEAFQTYAHHIKGFHVLPIYGGQGYDQQLRQLRRGVHVVVGTPGRVMDHIRRGTLKLGSLKTLVLDEADEMLRMGFIDDVEWILEHTPKTRQIALFSATMPAVIQKVANRHLNNPELVKIASKTSTATTIRQRYWRVSGLHKLDALTRILESEEFDGIIVFVRTKTATVELADKLAARGYSAQALNGDIAQNMREKIVDKLKKGSIDILVATDVVARGLDVERISHVINYDIPTDPESYVHRIGRTGRAGRSGEAILFVAPREQRLLQTIERVTKQPIESMQMPSTSDINVQRVARFKQRISDTLASEDLELFYQLVEDYQHEHDAEPLQMAAALARLAQGDEPLLLSDRPRKERQPREETQSHSMARGGPRVRERDSQGREFKPRNAGKKAPDLQAAARPLKGHPEVEMERFRLAVGYQHDVKPGNIVGAIANEAGLESDYIGHIEIYDDCTLIDLPSGMPREVLNDLKKVWVCGQQLNIARLGGPDEAAPSERKKKPAKKPRDKKAKAKKDAKKASRKKALSRSKAAG
jgi:ATP-dependent RNA helicase DeaD